MSAVIDHFVSLFTGLFVGVFLGLLRVAGALSEETFNRLLQPADGWLQVFGVLGFITSFWLFEWIGGVSAGKLLLGMVVLQEDGSPVNGKAALGRSLAYLVDAMFFGLVAHRAMSDGEQRQRLGDNGTTRWW